MGYVVLLLCGGPVEGYLGDGKGRPYFAAALVASNPDEVLSGHVLHHQVQHGIRNRYADSIVAGCLGRGTRPLALALLVFI